MGKTMFWQNYTKWTNECIDELNNQGYDVTENEVEVCDDGCVHFRGSFHITDPMVTPWKDSIFYVEYKEV